MTYASREKSSFAGEPVEIYEFSKDLTYFRYSASLTPGVLGGAVSYLGNDYAPSALTRTGPEVSSEYRKTNITLEMPAIDSFCQLFRIYVPAKTYWLTIYRGHRDPTTGVLDPAETVAYWFGRVRDVRFKGAQAEVFCDPVDSAIDRMCLRYQYQNGCNHALYGTQCGADREAFRMAATVVSINPDNPSEITLFSTGFNIAPTNGTDWFRIGEIVMLNGDRRMILTQGAPSALVESTTHSTITVGMPIENLRISDIVQLYAGCDRGLNTCATKFNNKIRNGGFAQIPGLNIFQFGLPPAVPY